MNLDKIFQNNKNWVKEKLEINPDYFNYLGKGQNPHILFIGCSDSRVTAEELMGLGPGDVFVHRNIANLIPLTDLNVLSVIEYGVKHLEVDQVVVCGHYECGGIKAALESTDYGVLNPWLEHIKGVVELHKNELESIENESKKNVRLAELNVLHQCEQLTKIDSVKRAHNKRRLKIHGWIFDVHTGHLLDLKFEDDIN
jgi:carbonic anhydrase